MGDMKTEQLQTGRGPAELAEGGLSQLGASHAENAAPQSAEGRNAGGQVGLPFLASGSEVQI